MPATPVKEALKETVLLCRDHMPGPIHPIWEARLELLWAMVLYSLKTKPDFWQEQLTRLEDKADFRAK